MLELLSLVAWCSRPVFHDALRPTMVQKMKQSGKVEDGKQ